MSTCLLCLPLGSHPALQQCTAFAGGVWGLWARGSPVCTGAVLLRVRRPAEQSHCLSPPRGPSVACVCFRQPWPIVWNCEFYLPLVSIGVEFAFFLFTLLVLITFRRKETNDCIVPLCLGSKSFDCNLSGWHHSITAKSMGFGAGHTWLLDYTCHLLSDNRQIRPSALPSLRWRHSHNYFVLL